MAPFAVESAFSILTELKILSNNIFFKSIPNELHYPRMADITERNNYSIFGLIFS